MPDMASDPHFVPQRLTLAREYRGLSVAELARQVLVSRQFLHQVETGDRRPADDLSQAMGTVLGFPPHFFERELGLVADEARCSFRRRASVSRAERRRVATYASLVGDLVAQLERFIELPHVRVPRHRARFPLDIEAAAAACRMAWDLGNDTPVGNVVRAVENAGIPVAETMGLGANVDAYAWDQIRPYILVSAAKGSSSRARWSVAHELGHIVLCHLSPDAPEENPADLEHAADRFASAFLMPMEAFAREFPGGSRFEWSRVLHLKERWSVSLAAMIRRAHDLGLIDGSRYRSSNVYLRVNGWHRGEPMEPARENPELLSIALDALPVEADIVDRLGWPSDVFLALTGREVNNDGIFQLHARTA